MTFVRDQPLRDWLICAKRVIGHELKLGLGSGYALGAVISLIELLRMMA